MDRRSSAALHVEPALVVADTRRDPATAPSGMVVVVSSVVALGAAWFAAFGNPVSSAASEAMSST